MNLHDRKYLRAYLRIFWERAGGSKMRSDASLECAFLFAG